MFFSVFGFSGSAQFPLLTTLHTGSAVAAVASSVLINARYMVMGIALNESLHGSRGRRALQAQVLVDASFMVAHRGWTLRHRADVRRHRAAVDVLGRRHADRPLLQPEPELMDSSASTSIFPAFFLLLVPRRCGPDARSWPRCVAPRSQPARSW